MSADADLRALAEGVQADLGRLQARRPEPPGGLPDRALIWLALSPVWTARMAAACGFPTEGEGDQRQAKRRLERLLASAGRVDPEVASAAQHSLGVVALGGKRAEEAEKWFRQALEGHRALDDQSAEAAAEFHLGVLAASKGDQDAARRWLIQAADIEVADHVARTAVQRQLARVSSVEQTLPSEIVLERDLEPVVLEACRVLDRIARSGLCRVETGNAPEGRIEAGERLTERRYWMTEVIRQEVLEEVIRDPSRGLQALKEELETIGGRVQAAESDGVPILRSVSRWAELAALATDVPRMASLLSSRCDALLGFNAVDDPDRSGTALGWIRAAEPLEGLLKGELTAALDRARRQLDLFHRRRDDDRRYLRHFLERPEQIRAVTELLSDRSAWALHFVGLAGTGKTMLMRYVSSVLGPRLGATTARIDFDYLNPDYPAQRRGLLLAELAEELRLNGEGEALSLFDQFDDQVLKLHEQTSESERGPSLAADVKASFAELLETFSQALAALPAPVILLIDTCEELAKVRPDGTSPEGVKETFKVLEALQRKVPGLRVIFAGRRALASCGDGWVAPGSEQLPARSYLRLHEIRGFEQAEALKYLEMEGVAEPLRSPILTQAEDRGDADRFVWTDPRKASAKVARYNPFELSGWAVLARRQGGETLTSAEILSTGSDVYVELRILRRIRYEQLKLALPAVALLGRFDRALLSHAVDGLPDFDTVFDELTQQEWITRRGVDIHELDEGLRRRLLAHYERVQPDDVELARQRAAEHLEHRTLSEPLSTLLPFHFDTAMRVLQREPARAALWWRRVETRFADEGQYEWARQLAEFMLGLDGACAEPDPSDLRSPPWSPLRPGVLATQLSCLLHTRSGVDRLASWREVEALLHEHDYPVPELAERLRLRALAGKVAAGLTPGVEPLPAELSALGAAMESALSTADPQLLSSFVAALEAAVEWAERETTPGQWSDTAAEAIRLAEMVREWAPLHEHNYLELELAGLRSFIASLAGRASLLRRRLDEAGSWLELSVRPTPESVDLRIQPWLDWLAPDELRARLWLEYLRGTYPALREAEEVLNAITFVSATSTIDAERLSAAVLTLKGAISLVGTGDRAIGEPSSRVEGEYTPTHNAHRAFPPLATVLAEAQAARGEVDLAVEMLSTAGRSYEQSTVELDAVADAERARLRIVRRMRLRDELRELTTPLVGSTQLEDLELLWSLDALDGAKAVDPGAPRVELGVPRGEDPAAWHHARWRTLCAPVWDLDVLLQFARDALLNSVPERYPPRAPSNQLSFSVFSLVLDAYEANELAVQAPLDPPFPRTSLPELSPISWWKEHRDAPGQALRLILRHEALAGRVPRPASVPWDLLRRLGHRRAAEIALDEGELLALRLPGHARPIIDSAADWFSQCHDHVGAVLSQGVAALAMARLGLPDEVSSLLVNRTPHDVEFLDFLPPWREVREIASTPSGENLDRLGPQGWRPWLVRLIACQAWKDGQGKPASTMQPLLDWIYAHYGLLRQPVRGESPTAEVVVPAELDGWLESRAQKAEHREPIRRVLRDPLALYWATITVRTQPSAPDGRAEVLLEFGGRTLASESMRLPEITRPYASLPKELPEALRTGLSRLRSESGDRRRVVEIRLEQGLGAPCWEAMLAGPPGEPADVSPLRVVRTLEERHARPRAAWRDIKDAVSVLSDLRQDEMATQGWRSLIRSDRYRHRIVRAGELLSEVAAAGEAHLLYLVATPIDTASGPRLELGRETGHGQQRSQASGAPRGTLLKPADVVRLVPGVVFCVLQGTPQERTTRTDAERRQAATLRLVAEEIFSLGVPAVVTIPTMPSSIAAEVLNALAEPVVSRPRRPVEALVDAVRKAGSRMAPLSGPDTARESAFDLCLYAAEDAAGAVRTSGGTR